MRWKTPNWKSDSFGFFHHLIDQIKKTIKPITPIVKKYIGQEKWVIPKLFQKQMWKLMGIFLNSFLFENREPILLWFKNKNKKREFRNHNWTAMMVQGNIPRRSDRIRVGHWRQKTWCKLLRDLCSVRPFVSESERCPMLDGGKAYSFLNPGLLLPVSKSYIGSHDYEVWHSY